MTADAPSANGASPAAEPRARAPKAKRDPIDAALPPAVDVHRFDEREKAALAPYIAAVAQAQGALAQALGLLVTGAGVDLATHSARLTDDHTGYVVQPLAAEG